MTTGGLLLVWYGITTAFAFIPAAAQEKYATMLKSQYMCLLALALLTAIRVYQLAIVMVVSLELFRPEGRHLLPFSPAARTGSMDPRGSAIEDNNHLAVGLVMVLTAALLALASRVQCVAALLGWPSSPCCRARRRSSDRTRAVRSSA